MRHFSKMAVVACVLISTGALAESTRHADAHVHGAGDLNFAVEGRQVHLELETPGFDILGFESITSEAQRNQLEDALSELRNPELWYFTASAACEFKSVTVFAGEDEHEDHGDHHNEHSGHHDHHHEHKTHHETAHMDISATYVYECAKIANLNSISTRLFQWFGNSEKLKVQGFTGSGQIAGEMTRKQPEVRF